jgi:hypothetical protein
MGIASHGCGDISLKNPIKNNYFFSDKKIRIFLTNFSNLLSF